MVPINGFELLTYRLQVSISDLLIAMLCVDS